MVTASRTARDSGNAAGCYTPGIAGSGSNGALPRRGLGRAESWPDTAAVATVARPKSLHDQNSPPPKLDVDVKL
ncbi:MAG: hypothetical protein WDN04_08785 [Rhodospirillales bacterium]